MKQEIIDRLYKIATTQARRNGFIFDSDVESELIHFITLGVNKIPNSQLNDKETIQLAERNIETFVNLMSRNSPGRIHRRSLDSDYLGFMVSESLGISSFNLAMRGFCPRFPFC